MAQWYAISEELSAGILLHLDQGEEILIFPHLISKVKRSGFIIELSYPEGKVFIQRIVSEGEEGNQDAMAEVDLLLKNFLNVTDVYANEFCKIYTEDPGKSFENDFVLGKVG